LTRASKKRGVKTRFSTPVFDGKPSKNAIILAFADYPYPRQQTRSIVAAGKKFGKASDWFDGLI
jgi:hypothetical protein